MLRMNLRLRAILASASLLIAIVLTVIPGVGFGFSFIFWIIFLVFVAGYIMFGTLSAAAKALGEQDMEGAEKALSYTLKPNWMLKMNRAYYYFIKGSIAMQRKQLGEAEGLFEKSLEIGLPTDNDKATALLYLANISYSKRKFGPAQTMLRQTKTLNITEPMLVMKIKEMEQAMKVRPQGGGMAGMMYGKKMNQRMMSKASKMQEPTIGKRGVTNNRKKKKKRK